MDSVPVRDLPADDSGGVLGGVRVLEIGDGVAIGTAGMLLADFGASVVKVEPPEGAPDRRLAGFAMRARGKCSVVVDRGRPADVTWLARMVAGADICIVDGSAESPWAAAVVQAAAAANGRLIVLDMAVYLDRHTPWTGGRESSRLLSAALGQATRQSSYDGGPVDSVSPHMLYVHGLWSAVCAVSAVLERATSGFGQRVSVTGAQGVMEATVSSLAIDPTLPDPDTAVGPAGRHPTYRPMRCAGGRWLASGALGGKFERVFLDLVGLSDLLQDPRLDGDPTRMILPENVGWCTELIDERVAAWDRDQLVTALLARGVPAGPMLERDEYLDHEQVRAIGMRVEVNGEDGGTVVMPGIPFVLTRTPGMVRASAPALGQDSGMRVWEELPRPVGRPPLRSGPLSGVRVLNLGTFVATPYAGMLLAELGAEVIKVEPRTGDPFRGAAYAVNRGMRSLAIDLKHPKSRDLLHRLVAQSDIVLDGMRPGVMRTLGLDYESLAQVNPEIVTVSLSAYGEGGHLSHAPGVDMVVQAMTGMMRAQGGDDVPVANTIAINDVTTAAMSALACVLALVERGRSGRGQRVWDSLLGTAGFLQMDDLVRYPARPPVRVGGRDYLGPTPLNRYYRAADGWVALDLPDNQDPCRCLEAAGFGDVGADADRLAAAFASRSTIELVTRLNAAGIPTVSARLVADVVRDPALIASEFVHIRPSASGGTFVVPGRLSTFGRTHRYGQLFPPGVGEHSRVILQSIGVSDAAIEKAIVDQVVAVGDPVAAELMAPYR